MLDENLPTFFIKPSTENELQSTVYLGQGGHELQPEYAIRRPDPQLPASKNCYAVALCDSFNSEVLFAEVLVQPEWTQPTLSQAEIRAQSQHNIPPPPVPVVPNSFTIQLYNPDQQVMVRQVAGSWNSSAYWEFEMPQQTFRVPSASALDRSQSDPAASITTPKVAFKWKRDGKLSKDITCFLSGKSTDGKKSKEPDITVAMFTHGKELTMYQPNMHRIDVEDTKGLEVVIILGALVIKDIFFNANKDIFNISSSTAATNVVRKNSGGLVILGGRPSNSPSVPSGGFPPPPPLVPASQIIPERVSRPYASTTSTPNPRPSPTNPRAEWEIEAETARLRAAVLAEEKARERVDQEEQKRIKKMLDGEEKERKRRDAEVAKETERLRKLYGVQPVPDNPANPRVHFTPAMPPRPIQQQYVPQQPPRPQYGQPPGRPQQLTQDYSAPHTTPTPVQRPSSVPAPVSNAQSSTWNSWWSGPGHSVPTQPQPTNNRHRTSGSASGPYLQSPAQQGGSASTSGFFGGTSRERQDRSRLLGIGIDGEGGRKKVQKKRSVYF